MNIQKRASQILSLNIKATGLDWLVHFDNGYWITNTDSENRGLIVFFSENYNEIKNKIENTLYMLNDAMGDSRNE